MIQLNLLPDVKLEYIRAQRSRRLVIAVAVLSSGVSVAILVLLLGVGALQKANLGNVNKDIAAETAELKGKPDIDKILTVQNQLGSLSTLHSQKLATSRIFEYINQVTPTDSGISSLKIDFTQKSAVLDGGSDSLSSVNKYVDTLKYTKYTVGSDKTTTPAFNNVVLKSFGLNPAGTTSARAASFSITLSYDPVIFDITKKVTLQVPTKVTTRAGLDKPGDLFQAAPIPAPVKRSN